MNTNDCNNFIQINHDALSFIGYIVDEYGDTLVIGSNKPFKESLPDYHHDYFYFCLTKATRSLLASNKLAEMRFREDAMILTRTAYETYLLIANVVNDENFIDISIFISLMLNTGEAKYLRRDTGKLDFHKVIINGVDNPIAYDMSVSTLAKKTFSKYDKLIHKDLYKYMSEFLHSDFISSGNYRTDDNKKYDVEPKYLYLDIHFLIMYITYLLLQSMYIEYKKYNKYTFNQIIEEEMSELNAILNKLKRYLHTILSKLDLSMRSSNLKDLIFNRIDENII